MIMPYLSSPVNKNIRSTVQMLITVKKLSTENNKIDRNKICFTDMLYYTEL